MDTAMEVMADSKSLWSIALKPYAVTAKEIAAPLRSSEKDIGIEPSNVGSMRNISTKMVWGLQMLVACQTTESSFYKLVGVDGWLKKRAMAISSTEFQLRPEKKMRKAHKTIKIDLMKLHSLIKCNF